MKRGLVLLLLLGLIACATTTPYTPPPPPPQVAKITIYKPVRIQVPPGCEWQLPRVQKATPRDTNALVTAVFGDWICGVLWQYITLATVNAHNAAADAAQAVAAGPPPAG